MAKKQYTDQLSNFNKYQILVNKDLFHFKAKQTLSKNAFSIQVLIVDASQFYFQTISIQYYLVESAMEEFQWEQRDSSTPFYIHLLAGSIAGVTEHLVMLPVDNVKTHCQAGSRQSIKQIVKQIYRKGGISNFYSGSSVIASGCAPAHAISFAIYEASKNILECNAQEDNIKFAIVGAVSSLFHDLIMTPSEVVKQRLQLMNSQSGKIKNMKLIKMIYKEQGIKSFYRSLPVNYFLSVPFGSLIVMLNEKIKNYFKISKEKGYINYYLSGGLAGLIASIPTCPFDVIKTKLNTQTCLKQNCKGVCSMMSESFLPSRNYTMTNKTSTNFAHGLSQNIVTLKPMMIKYQNMIDTCQTIYKQQGLLGFFKGMKMRMMIQSFSSAVAWGTYQIIKSNLQKIHHES